MKRFAKDFLRPRVLSRTCYADTLGNYLIRGSRTSLEQSHLTFHSGRPSFVSQWRNFSASPTAASTTEATTQAGKKKNDSNIFLDNLGKVFLMVIAGIIATLYRSSRSTVNRNSIRDSIEETSVIDPVEIDELRLANSELQPEVYRTIMRDLVNRYPQGLCSYDEFLMTTRSTMAGLKGDAFTIQLGHLVDRVVIEILKKYGKNEDEPLPLSLWLTTLSLALSSSVEERMEVLFEALEIVGSGTPVTITQVEEMVSHLQDTCQLPADSQIVLTEEQYPTQKWVRGNARELVPWEGSMNEAIDLEAFRSILRTKSVCAWGECYHKKKL